KEGSQEDLLSITEEVFERGSQTIKFYYMIGLPTETDEDLDGIVEATQKAARIGRKYHGRKALINVTLSPFVPKSNTPFQWEAQVAEEELHRRYQYVRRRLKSGNIDVKTADTGSSFVEAVLARGDRRLGKTLRRAWELGCKFDGWSEYFNLNLWMEAFRQTGLDPKFYANRQREEDEVFPFDHLDSNLGKRFLWADQRRAWRQRVMERCEIGKCAGCDACDDKTEHILARGRPGATDEMERYPEDISAARETKTDRLETGRKLEDPDKQSMVRAAEALYHRRAKEQASRAGAEKPEQDSNGSAHHAKRERAEPLRRFPEPAKVQRLRVSYTKLDSLRYLGHLDLAKVVGLALRRAGAPLAYSEGFNPKPRVQFPPPLPLGVGGRRELFDVVLIRTVVPRELIRDLNAVTVPGLGFLSAEEIDLKEDSLECCVAASRFAVEMEPDRVGLSLEEVRGHVAEFERCATFAVDVKKKRRIKEIDLRESVSMIEVEESSSNGRQGGAGASAQERRILIKLDIQHRSGLFVQPQIALGFILGRPIERGNGVRIDRERLILIAQPSALSGQLSAVSSGVLQER
ncbi:DUF2344 domain-containing protein, partial [Candidatus Sumerlaeota bacterium]|nr:DUF2344 domain-containing protein [Candidatus Sumerlaeota bacterium]